MQPTFFPQWNPRYIELIKGKVLEFLSSIYHLIFENINIDDSRPKKLNSKFLQRKISIQPKENKKQPELFTFAEPNYQTRPRLTFIHYISFGANSKLITTIEKSTCGEVYRAHDIRSSFINSWCEEDFRK